MSRSDLHETAYRIFELTALSKSDVIGDPVSKMCAFQLFEAARMFKLFREREWFSLGSADQLEKISIASAVYSDKLRSDMYEVVELEGGGTAPVHVAAADLLTDISKILAAANFRRLSGLL